MGNEMGIYLQIGADGEIKGARLHGDSDTDESILRAVLDRILQPGAREVLKRLLGRSKV